MSSQIEINQILNYISEFGDNLTGSTYACQTHIGDINNVIGNGNVQYPLFVVDLISSEVNKNTIIHNIDVICCSNQATDKSDYLNKLTITHQILVWLFYYLENSQTLRENNIFLEDKTANTRAFPFKYLDGTIGHVLQLKIKVQNRTRENVCHLPILGGIA